MSSTTPHQEAQNPPANLVNKKAVFTPSQLNIVWGKDPRYWKIAKDNNNDYAELLQVCWLEVSGSIPISSSSTGDKFKISFKVSLKSDAFGWNNCPIYVMAKFGKKGKYTWRKVILSSSDTTPFSIPPEPLEIELDKTKTPEETIHFGLYEVWSGKWKGGLVLHSATVEKV